MYNLLAQYLLRDWELDIRIADIQSLSMLPHKRLGIRITDVQYLSTQVYIATRSTVTTRTYKEISNETIMIVE